MTDDSVQIPADSVESSILLIRNQKVILDRTLAKLYGVSTRMLNQAVKRNPERFPEDFMFQLTPDETRAFEAMILRSQIVTLKKPQGKHIKYRPYAFTEHGILMLSNATRRRGAKPDWLSPKNTQKMTKSAFRSQIVTLNMPKYRGRCTNGGL